MQYDTGPNCMIIVLPFSKALFFHGSVHKMVNEADDYRSKGDASVNLELEQGFVCIWNISLDEDTTQSNLWAQCTVSYPQNIHISEELMLHGALYIHSHILR